MQGFDPRMLASEAIKRRAKKNLDEGALVCSSILLFTFFQFNSLSSYLFDLIVFSHFNRKKLQELKL